jgi:uncharacterized membrane protein
VRDLVGQVHAALTGGGLAGGSPSGARSGSLGGTSSGGGDGSGSLVGGGASGSTSGGIGVCKCKRGIQGVFVVIVIVVSVMCVHVNRNRHATGSSRPQRGAYRVERLLLDHGKRVRHCGGKRRDITRNMTH